MCVHERRGIRDWKVDIVLRSVLVPVARLLRIPAPTGPAMFPLSAASSDTVRLSVAFHCFTFPLVFSGSRGFSWAHLEREDDGFGDCHLRS